jgi:putative DNA primase/helicase
VRSCGAWWDKGRSIINLGDRLIIDGSEHAIREPVPDSRFIYKGSKRIEGAADTTPLDDEEAMMILLIAQQFLWEGKASGYLIAGWATLAPICGVLDWRPHAWLTASSESGKSTLMNRYLAPLLGDMRISVYGQSSEAGIRQKLDSKALAVIFDEAESNERKDKARIQDVLTLARISSTESEAQMLKGSADGNSISYSIRSMFLLCSIVTGLKQGADKNRFAQLTLQNPSILGEGRHESWKKLDRELDQFITPEIGRRLQARTIQLIPMIRKATRTFVDAASVKFGSRRMGDQYGTLVAGAWSLTSSVEPTPEQARTFLDAIEGWQPYKDDSTGTPDERSCIETILQHQLRVELERSSLNRTITELIDLADAPLPGPDELITSKVAIEHLGRIGLKVSDGRLYVHNNAAGIRRILADTPWSDCWPTVLRRLPDATKHTGTRFFSHRGTHRATSVPLAALAPPEEP